LDVVTSPYCAPRVAGWLLGRSWVLYLAWLVDYLL
jgi:hypothetical protein